MWAKRHFWRRYLQYSHSPLSHHSHFSLLPTPNPPSPPRPPHLPFDENLRTTTPQTGLKRPRAEFKSGDVVSCGDAVGMGMVDFGDLGLRQRGMGKWGVGKGRLKSGWGDSRRLVRV